MLCARHAQKAPANLTACQKLALQATQVLWRGLGKYGSSNRPFSLVTGCSIYMNDKAQSRIERVNVFVFRGFTLAGGLFHDSSPRDSGKTMWILFMAMNGDPGDMQPLFDFHPATLVFAAGAQGARAQTPLNICCSKPFATWAH